MPIELITKEQFKAALPPQIKKSVNQILIDQINATLNEPDALDTLRENLLSYGSVMRDGKFKIPNYINAVKYVSHKLLGRTNKEAYVKTFPDKYLSFVTKGVKERDIASYITAYNKGKLVNLIFEQTLIPSYVLNYNMFQEALNVQADLMLNAKSEKVKSDAANSLLVHLKRPETTKIELDIGVSQDKTLDVLRASTLELVEQQKKLMQEGILSAKQVAEKVLVDAEDIIDVN